jgi:hypothetical protein
MVRVLVEAGLLQTTRAAVGGNRNRLTLTSAGEQLVRRWGTELEQRFASLVEAAGVPYRAYLTHTKRLLAGLDTPPTHAQRQTAARSARSRQRSQA